MSRMPLISELLGIRYPLIQGGMAWVSDAGLAAAVSEAGGLGVIAAGNMPADALRSQIDRIRGLTQKPFGVNVMLLSPYAPEVSEMLAGEEVPVIITGAGDPARYVDAWKRRGSHVLAVVASTALARRLSSAGVDALIAEGSEAGGHIGELTTMALVPGIVDAVELPVVAAGGICDARTVAAAFCLGARGVQVGTRFIVANECAVHENYKNSVLEARDIDSKVTGRVTGHPVRVLRNKLVRQMLREEYEPGGAARIEEMGTGALRRAVVDGDRESGSFMAGQCAYRIDRAQSVRDIIGELFDAAALGEIRRELGRDLP
ncbi:MAG: DUF561 domain-containing protein [Clostridiales bacterium]|nr:DUF561 domain-containing protein [Clostridiales bacterium]